MQILELIQHKRSGGRLGSDQLDWLVRGALDGSIPDYQLAALLMAICYEGLDLGETVALTRAFIESGEQLSWQGLDGPVVDKHSTGGVGDKVSLLLVPWLAAAGCKVPKMSGRGLGHTGGTIDKLESIPGFRTVLSSAELHAQLAAVGCAIVAQSADLVPADRLFYALRDATGTVNEMGLIAASIMSKKIAGGAEHIVLDVKCGNGAFFTDHTEAEAFAGLAVSVGTEFGRNVAYAISPMDAPLGRAVGNALEVAEVLEIAAECPLDHPLVDNCLELSSLLHVSAGLSADLDAARKKMLDLLTSGAVMARVEDWLAAQGGRLAEFRKLLAREQQSRRMAVKAERCGTISAINALGVGRLANRLGAGRSRKDQAIDPFAGVELMCRIGDRIEPGDELAALYPGATCAENREELAAALRSAFSMGE